MKKPIPFPEYAARCEGVRMTLQKHMTDLGLHEHDGWRIYEFTREVEGRKELVMRPVHRSLNPPSDLECVCIIDEPDAKVHSECTT